MKARQLRAAYINQDGACVVVRFSPGPVGTMTPIPLRPGDTGARSVTLEVELRPELARK